MSETDTTLEAESEVLVWNADVLVSQIVNAVKSHEISEKSLPDAVDISNSSISEMCDKLYSLSHTGEHKFEHGAAAKVDRNGEFVFGGDIGAGNEETVSTSIRISPGESLCFAAHTHAVEDLPPSPTDVSILLRDAEDNDTQAEIVIGLEKKYLLVRTLQTPSMTSQEIQMFKDEYRNDMDKRFLSTMSRWAMETLESKANESKDVDVEKVLNLRKKEAQEELLLEKCRDKHIAVYIAESGDDDGYYFQRV